MIKNPNFPIRAAYIAALKPVIGVPVWYRKVPKSVKEIPSVYILLTSQTKSRAAQTKCGYEWEASIIVDIIGVYESGYADIEMLDDIEEKATNAIQSLGRYSVDGFELKDSRLEDSYESSIDTDTQSISRNIIRFTHRLNQIDQ